MMRRWVWTGCVLGLGLSTAGCDGGGAGGGGADGSSTSGTSSSTGVTDPSTDASSSGGDASSEDGSDTGATSGTPCQQRQDCAELDAACALGECVDGTCESIPLPAGTEPTLACEGNLCDGVGSCVECVEAGDCEASDCEIASCDAGTCTVAPDRSDACAAFEGMLAFGYPSGVYRIDPATGFVLPEDQAPLVVDSFTGTGFEHVTVNPGTGSFIVGALARMEPDAGPAVPFAVSHLDLQARAFHPETGALWAVTSTDGIAVVDLDTGLPSSTLFATLPGPKGPDVITPSAIAFDDAGALHAVHDDALYTVDLGTGAMQLVLALPADARALVFVASEGRFYAAAGDADHVYRIDGQAGTVESVSVPGLPDTGRLAYDPAAEVMYGFPPTDAFLSEGRSFHTIDPGAGTWAFGRHFGIEDANAVAYDAGTGRVLVASDGNELFAVDVDAQTFDRVGTMPVPVLVGEIEGMTFDDAGALYGLAGGNSIDGGMLYQIDPNTADVTAVGPLPLGDYGDPAYDPDSGLLFTTFGLNENPLARQLLTIDPATATSVSLGVSQAVSGLGYVEETGLIYGIDDGLRLVSIDPDTGTTEVIGIAGTTAHYTPVTVVDGVLTALAERDARVTFDLETGHASISGVPAWAELAAYDPVSEDVVLVRAAGGSITYRYDPVTNLTTTVADDGPPVFAGEFSIDSSGTGYVLSFGSLFEVDLSTGAATLVAEGDVAFAAAFDDDDVLYAAVNAFPDVNLATVDVATGAFTTIATLDGLVREMEWDAQNERLVGLVGDPQDDRISRYVEIDRATGAMTTLTQVVPYYADGVGLTAVR